MIELTYLVAEMPELEAEVVTMAVLMLVALETDEQKNEMIDALEEDVLRNEKEGVDAKKTKQMKKAIELLRKEVKGK